MTIPNQPNLGQGGRLRVLGKVLPEDARAHNRALGWLFHGGAMTRADLARAIQILALNF